jgi:methylmalonyl-CoA/ethylmalonyl-CoA epimerase
MTLYKVDHIDVRVPDLAVTVRFLEQLGLDVVRRLPAPRESAEMALPGAGQVIFEIREADVAATTVDHIAFAADETAVAELKARGITFDRERALIAATGRRVSNLCDPSGARWQLAE